MKNNTKKIQISIILGAIIVSISLIFLGTQINKNNNYNKNDTIMDKKIEEQISNYIKKQEDEFKKEQYNIKDGVTAIVDVSIDDDPILGDPDAPVTIVEFSDYECPFCKRYYNQAFQKIKKNYIDKGLVKVVYRDFPLPFHDPLASQEATAASCAREQGDDEMYYKYHDLIFDNTRSNGKGLEKNQLYVFAEELNLDGKKFKECLDSNRYTEEIQKDIADGRSYGVSGTPGFFINGRSIKGAQPFEKFKIIIEEELAKIK